MHSSHFIEADRPTDCEVQAAARELDWWGREHGWWPQDSRGLDLMDPISREEFEAIVVRILMSAAAAKRGVATDG